MDLLGLTTTEQVRSVLTVSEHDLPLETMAGYALDDDLAADLQEWLPDWGTVVPEADVENRRLLRLFSKYFCAATLAGVLPLFALKKVSDGSNEGQRSDVEGFSSLRWGLLEKADRNKSKLLAALEKESAEPARYALVGRVVPARDVITEARSDAPE